VPLSGIGLPSNQYQTSPGNLLPELKKALQQAFLALVLAESPDTEHHQIFRGIPEMSSRLPSPRSQASHLFQGDGIGKDQSMSGRSARSLCCSGRIDHYQAIHVGENPGKHRWPGKITQVGQKGDASPGRHQGAKIVKLHAIGPEEIRLYSPHLANQVVHVRNEGWKSPDHANHPGLPGQTGQGGGKWQPQNPESPLLHQGNQRPRSRQENPSLIFLWGE
jgi:hypothetical protein